MNCAQIGPPGTGKTESLKTIEGFCKATKKPFALIDADGKAEDCQELRRLFKEGIFERFDPGSRLTEGSFKDRIRTIDKAPSAPKGWMGYAEIVDEISANADKFCGVALDTVSPIEDHMKQYIAAANNTMKFEFAQWSSLLLSWKELFNFFYALEVPLKIINMHSQYDKDEFTGRVTMLPLMTGSFRDQAGKYPSEFYFCFAKQGSDKSKPPEYRWRVTPNDQFVARSNVFKGNTDVPQDWTPVWKSLL